MKMMKILKYTAIVCLLGGIVYFGCKMANAGDAEKGNAGGEEKAHAGVAEKAEAHVAEIDEPAILDLTDIDRVTAPTGLPSIMKDYEGFSVSFNPENRTPNYVAWTLSGHETKGTTSRSNKFWTDKEVKGCPDTRDYSRSGYDRGHMCPAGEQKWSDEAMHHSFVMTNICPQNHDLNTGAWKTLEDKERIWANRDSAIVIVAGPIYDDSDTETIGYNKVRVPSAFFKVLLAPYANPIRAIGFVYPNMRCDGNMSEYATTVDEVEKMTGMDFFAILPDDIENDIEATSSFREWNSNKKKKKNTVDETIKR